MSELNRMLSDLSSSEKNANRVAPAAIPSVWGFRFARVALALIATLLGATGISWAWVSGDNKASTVEAQPLPVQPNATISRSVEAVKFVSEGQSLMPSPTQKIVTREMGFVEANTTVSVKPQTHAVNVPEPTMTSPVVTEPVRIAQVQAVQEKVAQTKVVQAKAVEQKATPEKRVIAQDASLQDTASPQNIASPQGTASTQETSPTPSLSVETIELSGEELAEIAYDKAQKRAQVGDTKKATAYLRDAVKYDANHIAATNQLAGLLYGRNQLRDAEAVLRQGIRENPSSASLKLTLARMYQQSQREESALNVLMAPASHLDSDQVRYVSLRASLAQKLSKHDVAKRSYQWLAEREPLDGRWWLGLGISAERDKDYINAEKGYKKAITSGGLSDKSVQFARQRLAYLQSQPVKSQSVKGADNGR